MARAPDAALTAVQFEIMQVVWQSAAGVTVAEIWDAIAQRREVTRTTVLNLVGRLAKRGWLQRQKREGVYRYVATIDRETATAGVAEKVVDEFFGGSATELVMSLLGSQKISADEVEQLRQLLQGAGSKSRKP